MMAWVYGVKYNTYCRIAEVSLLLTGRRTRKMAMGGCDASLTEGRIEARKSDESFVRQSSSIQFEASSFLRFAHGRWPGTSR